MPITTPFTPHILMAMLSIKDGGVSTLPTSTVIATVFTGKGLVVMECRSDTLRFVKLGGKMKINCVNLCSGNVTEVILTVSLHILVQCN